MEFIVVFYEFQSDMMEKSRLISNNITLTGNLLRQEMKEVYLNIMYYELLKAYKQSHTLIMTVQKDRQILWNTLIITLNSMPSLVQGI